jgi:hypothetical protein
MAIVDENGIGIVFKLKNDIRAIEARIADIQENCSHPSEALTDKAGANTGNYCPGDDSYWVDFHCHLCDKKWREDR